MANVIECPRCQYVIKEADAQFWAHDTKPDHFVVKHLGECGYVWTTHHREFYPEGGPRPRPRNPFEPVRFSL